MPQWNNPCPVSTSSKPHPIFFPGPWEQRRIVSCACVVSCMKLAKSCEQFLDILSGCFQRFPSWNCHKPDDQQSTVEILTSHALIANCWLRQGQHLQPLPSMEGAAHFKGMGQSAKRSAMNIWAQSNCRAELSNLSETKRWSMKISQFHCLFLEIPPTKPHQTFNL